LIRALVVDIDGTLTDQNRVLCPQAVEALRCIKLPVILATGNTHCFTRTVSVLLGTPKIFISENGGVVSYSEKEMEILADLEKCEKAFEELSQIFPLERYNSDSTRYRFTDIALKRNFDITKAAEYVRAHGLEVEIIDTAFAVHIKDRKVSKGTGLLRVAEKMGLHPKQFAAIGDSGSDLPMYEIAGYRASVANATSELKEASDYVAPSSYGLGFAEIVKHIYEERMF
jgi:phosphoglycolate phosphatase (TIGR01487 family)